MTKWTVKRGEYSELFGTHDWDIYSPKGHWEGSFLTWRESMDCADDLARTVEIKLPRVARQGMYHGPMPETPYPCGCEEGDTCEVQCYVVGTEDGVWAHNPPFWEARPADMKAVAHFPEAVAEVVRLRRALEEMKAEYKEMSEEEFRFGYERSGLWHGDVARHLTRILEGHKDGNH